MNAKLKQLLNSKKVFIIDFDGTIADTEPLNYETLRRLIAADGFDFTHEQFEQVVGKTAQEYIDYINSLFGTDYDLSNMADTYNDTYFAVEKDISVAPFSYLLEVLNMKGKRCVILSNMADYIISEMLLKMGIADCFESIYSNSTLGIKKQDFYNDTQKYLGVDAQDCVVFEDSQRYLSQAKAAGITTVGIQHKYNGTIDADFIIKE